MEIDGKALAGSDDQRVCYGFATESREFFDCIRQGQKPLTEIDEGVKAMELVDFLRARRL